MAEYKYQAYPKCVYRFDTRSGKVDSHVFPTEQEHKAAKERWAESPDQAKPPWWWRFREWAKPKLQPNGFAGTLVIAVVAAIAGALIQKHC